MTSTESLAYALEEEPTLSRQSTRSDPPWRVASPLVVNER